MRKTVKRALPLALALMIGAGALSVCAFPRTAAAEGDYYAPITATGGEELLGQLHDLITTTHTHYCSYNECRDNAKKTDPAIDGEGGIVEFYTHEPIRYYINDLSTKGGQGTWNREHVWPKSLSNNLWGTEGGGSDLHHIRPSEVKMNADRGNDKFGEAVNGGAIYSKTTDGQNSMIGGHHAGGVFEPLDSVKGDAARIVLYMYTHYNKAENVHGTTNGKGPERYFGTLKLTNIMAASSEEAAAELLLEWNKLDPVDEIETRRNEETYRLQGNRNPFIDHPEYADQIWDLSAVDPDPVDPDPVDPDPVDPDPVDPEPVDPEPVDPEPVDPEPTDPEPAEPEPVDPDPVDPEPVDPDPVDPDPVGPEPADPEPVGSGCGGTIGGTGAAVFAAALFAAAVAIRRKP